MVGVHGSLCSGTLRRHYGKAGYGLRRGEVTLAFFPLPVLFEEGLYRRLKCVCVCVCFPIHIPYSPRLETDYVPDKTAASATALPDQRGVRRIVRRQSTVGGVVIPATHTCHEGPVGTAVG